MERSFYSFQDLMKINENNLEKRRFMREHLQQKSFLKKKSREGGDHLRCMLITLGF